MGSNLRRSVHCLGDGFFAKAILLFFKKKKKKKKKKISSRIICGGSFCFMSWCLTFFVLLAPFVCFHIFN